MVDEALLEWGDVELGDGLSIIGLKLNKFDYLLISEYLSRYCLVNSLKLQALLLHFPELFFFCNHLLLFYRKILVHLFNKLNVLSQLVGGLLLF